MAVQYVLVESSTRVILYLNTLFFFIDTRSSYLENIEEISKIRNTHNGPLQQQAQSTLYR